MSRRSVDVRTLEWTSSPWKSRISPFLALVTNSFLSQEVTLYASRNDALQFAIRTRRNLLFIENAHNTNEEVHPITQLVNSMLGLVVLPLEKHFIGHIKQLEMDELVKQGWPKLQITIGHCQNLGYLVKRLRNATAHGHLTFSSDSHHAEDVVILVEDYKPKATKPFWVAQLTAGDLRKLSLKFIELIEETVG